MVAHGYLAYLIRATPPHRTRYLQRLSDLGFDHVDLLAAADQLLGDMGGQFYRNDGMAEGYRLRAHAVRGRSIFIQLRRGPVGNPGETFDVESGESVETGVTTALLSELRAAIYVPRDSYFGFLLVERVGGRHLKDLLYKRIIKPASHLSGMAVRVDGFAQTDDWRAELAGQQVLRVTEILKPTDTADDSSTVDDLTVKMVAEGSGLSSRTDDLKDRLLDLLDRRHAEYRLLTQTAPLEARRKIWGTTQKRDGTTKEGWKTAPKASFTVADQAELDRLVAELTELNSGNTDDSLTTELQSVLPDVDRDEYESRRLEVSFGQDRPEKTFVVTGDRVPQLVYEFGERLLDTQLRAAWDASSEQFLRGLGVQLSSGWPLEPARAQN